MSNLDSQHQNLASVEKGVYTQRFNRVEKVDGPLFRGRYKSILVDSDNYLLELTKYIHRNPIQTKNKQDRLVNNLCDYQWSSYQYYLGIKGPPQLTPLQ